MAKNSRVAGEGNQRRLVLPTDVYTFHNCIYISVDCGSSSKLSMI